MNFKFIRSTKISVKITILYTLMILLLLLFLNASILYGVKYYLYFQADNQVKDIKTIILNKLTPKNQLADLFDKELISDVSTKQNLFVKITGENGNIINISDKFNYNAKIAGPYDKVIHSEYEDKHVIYENIRLVNNENNIFYIQIVKDMTNEYSFMKILFYLMAMADGIGVIVSIFLGYFVSKKMLTPIANITKAAENISINNLKERIQVKGPDDELKRLANTFNDMIDRLQEAFEKQVQFVADASHELRTPIAVINGYANLLNRWGKDDKEALEKSILAIKLESENMANLVEKLLFLAKGDSGTQNLEKKKFMINELIYDTVEESRLIDQKHSITSNKNDIVRILADYKMIKQMLRALIHNSIKFTPDNGSIDVSSIVQGKTVKIIVSDTGIGIPKDEIKNIFNRFYIVDKSRSKELGGTGLGLSIAKYVLDMHKGTIVVESEEGKGTKIIITLCLEE